LRSFILQQYQNAHLYVLTVRVVLLVAACFVVDGARALFGRPRSRRPR
jgi:hypothetical protein